MKTIIKQKLKETQKEINSQTACYNRTGNPTDKARVRHELDKLEVRYQTLMEVYKMMWLKEKDKL